MKQYTKQLEFWSSGKLTGNQTYYAMYVIGEVFWSSGKLTGNQTLGMDKYPIFEFWSSGKLTGNQTAGTRFTTMFRVLEQWQTDW